MFYIVMLENIVLQWYLLLIVFNNLINESLLLIVRRSSSVAFNESASTSENASDWQSICLHRPANVAALLASASKDAPAPLPRVDNSCSDISTLPASLIGIRLNSIKARIQLRTIKNRGHRWTCSISSTYNILDGTSGWPIHKLIVRVSYLP